MSPLLRKHILCVLTFTNQACLGAGPGPFPVQLEQWHAAACTNLLKQHHAQLLAPLATTQVCDFWHHANTLGQPQFVVVQPDTLKATTNDTHVHSELADELVNICTPCIGQSSLGVAKMLMCAAPN